MKINISANIDVHPHRVSKPTDMPTISESRVVEFGDRTRAAMRKTWMKHARMTGEINIMHANPVETQSRHFNLTSGLNMLRIINAKIGHKF